MRLLVPLLVITVLVVGLGWTAVTAASQRGTSDWPLASSESPLVKTIRTGLFWLAVAFIAVGMLLGVIVMVVGIVRTI